MKIIANPIKTSHSSTMTITSKRVRGVSTADPSFVDGPELSVGWLVGVTVGDGVSVSTGKINVMAGNGTRVVVGVPATVGMADGGALGENAKVGRTCVGITKVGVLGPGYGVNA
jgi:hypothetical protein